MRPNVQTCLMASNPKTREAWARWPFLVPFAGRVVALQGMHPTVSAGLEDHSSLFEDPWGRGAATIRYGLDIVFGDTEAVAAEIRELHRDIRGTGYDGHGYHAWNREAWTWVHLSTFDATRYALRAIGRGFARDDEAAFYDEWRSAGRLYGVQERDTPADLDAFEDYLEEVIEHRLVPTPTSKWLLTQEAPAPPWLPIPPAAWSLTRVPATARTLLVGGFPAKLRERHGLSWSPLDRLQHTAALTALRVAAALPDRLSHFPAAYDAHTAERHPRLSAVSA